MSSKTTKNTILRLRQWSGMRYGRDLNDIHEDVQVLLCEYTKYQEALECIRCYDCAHEGEYAEEMYQIAQQALEEN